MCVHEVWTRPPEWLLPSTGRVLLSAFYVLDRVDVLGRGEGSEYFVEDGFNGFEGRVVESAGESAPEDRVEHSGGQFRGGKDLLECAAGPVDLVEDGLGIGIVRRRLRRLPRLDYIGDGDRAGAARAECVLRRL